MASIRFKRGTRSAINAAAAANGLTAGEPYLITDETRIAVGTGANTYKSFLRQDDAIVAPEIHAATGKTTPVDADELGLVDSAASNVLKKLTWANLKAALFASPALTGTPTAPTASAGTSNTQLATTAYVNAEIAADAAPIAHVGSGGSAHANAVASGAAGFMTGTDKAKLDGIAAGATANTGTVTAVTGTGAIASTGGTTPQISIAAASGSVPGSMSAANFTKLAGIATGATANATDAQLRDRSTHTGTQSADTLTDGTTNKAFLATERTKLTGIATGATANSADATLLARANHTGTQAPATILMAATARLLGRTTAGGGAAEELTASQAKTLLSLAKSDVGLSNVDNTADTAKPVSAAQQAALDLKANLASPPLTGTPTAPTAAQGTSTTQLATTAYVNAEIAADAAPLSHVGSGGSAHANAVAAGAAGFMTGADKTKLDGVAAGATANSSDAILLARVNHTGTQSADTLTDGTTNKAFLATERTKLAGIATGATANDTDANLRDRSTHTGAQATSTITGLDTALAGKAPLTGAGTSGTWGISITGLAATATQLATPRNINGVSFNGTANITIVDATKREKLTAARSYYVRSDGNDSNTGLANSSGGAFATIQKAIDTVASIDNGIYDVTIYIGTGTSTAPLALKTIVGAGKVIIRGINADSTSTVISTTSASAVVGSYFGTYRLQYLKVQTTTGGNCFEITGSGSKFEYQDINFGPSPANHIYVGAGAYVIATGSYSITGGAFAHLYAADSGVAFISSGFTVTLTGTPAFASAFLQAERVSSVVAAGVTFSGAATGSRYIAATNAIITTFGGATYFPGNAAGSVSSGGVYQ